MAVIKSQFTLRLNLETHVKLQKMAAAESRSMTNMIEYLLKNDIAQYEKSHGKIVLNEEDLSLE